MRSFLVGLCFLLLSTAGASVGFAQVDGFVESIGFQGHYRPNCWTPMVVNLTSRISEPESYLVRVRQEDLDGDRVVYEKTITLGGKAQDKFWLYFLPKPTGGGLPDPADPGVTVKQVEESLVVELCTKNGKPLKKLPVGRLPLFNVDRIRGEGRGNKLILYVVDPSVRNAPARREWDDVIGMSESVTWVQASPLDLPENPVAYQAVDYVVWLDANAGDLEAGGSRRLPALRHWVEQGGRLVVCQPAERHKILPFAAMLPVETTEGAGRWVMDIRERRDLRPLRELARHKEPLKKRTDLWEEVAARKGPFMVAHAVAKPDAVVDAWVDWGPPPKLDPDGEPEEVDPRVQPKNGSPYIARGVYGHGSVTWVAQDLSNPVIVGTETTGWPYLWAAVFGWNNPDMRLKDDASDALRNALGAGEFSYEKADLGYSLLKGMEHQGRAGFFVFLAVVFFIGYWVVAGPGSYVVLANNKKKQLSWMAYALAALVATGLTVVVVKLVLRGRAEARHVSLVRVSPAGLDGEGKPTFSAVVDSRVGLYIPRDGPQLLSLGAGDDVAVSYLTPFPQHPSQMGDAAGGGFTDWLQYTVPMPDPLAEKPPAVSVPYRSTLKKLHARWSGKTAGGVGGSAKLIPAASRRLDRDGDGKPDANARAGTIEGVLSNDTGSDLKNVYFAFNFRAYNSDTDWVLYVPRWPKGGQIDLLREFNDPARVSMLGSNPGTGPRAFPGNDSKRSIKGWLTGPQGHWDEYWLGNISPGGGGGAVYDDAHEAVPRSYPVLTFFDRLPPEKKQADTGGFIGMAGGVRTNTRTEMLRYGGRHLDLSHLLAAGQLVIVAQAEADGQTSQNPLPLPLYVDGDDAVSGTGTTLYQFALPLDRTELEAEAAKDAAAAEEDRRRREQEERRRGQPEQVSQPSA